MPARLPQFADKLLVNRRDRAVLVERLVTEYGMSPESAEQWAKDHLQVYPVSSSAVWGVTS